MKNFRIHTSPMQGDELSNLSDSIFNYMWERTRKRINYGYLAIEMDDVLTKQCEFTYCSDYKRGLSVKMAEMVESFIYGWFINHRCTLYHFEWVNF